MSPTLPHSVAITEPSSKLSRTGDVSLQTAILATHDVTQQQTTKTIQAQTTDYGEPSATSCLALRPRKLIKRFAKFMRWKRDDPKGVPSPRQSIQSSDRDSNQPLMVSESGSRGRKTTARLPLGTNRPPTLYDDGQGSWISEFGYIYRGGMDMTRSRLSLGNYGNDGTVTGPSLEAKNCHQRVDSRTVKDLKDASNGAVDQEPRETRNMVEAGVESDNAQDQRPSEDDGAHKNTEDQHTSDEMTEAESPEDRCESCHENDDPCDNAECSCQSSRNTCSDVDDDRQD